MLQSLNSPHSTAGKWTAVCQDLVVLIAQLAEGGGRE